jgi:hypothetical protein
MITNEALKIIFEYSPSVLGAIFAGAATIISSFALRKGNENGKKADVANKKADAIAEKTEDIHRLADGNLSRITEDLRVANENISNLKGLDDKRLITILERHQTILNRLDGDMCQLTDEVKSVRERQHDLANFLNGIGLKYELKPIESKPSGD